MDKGQKDKTIEKLAKDFHVFYVEWKKFLGNDFSHLTGDVDTLIKQNDKQHNEINQGMRLMQTNVATMTKDVATMTSISTTLINQNKVTHRKLGVLEKNVLIILKNTTIP